MVSGRNDPTSTLTMHMVALRLYLVQKLKSYCILVLETGTVIICNQARNKSVEAKAHNCYKNWTESSQAREADIILCGFLQAERSHGLRYTTLIADGNSSVFPQLQEKVPIWGRSIEKLECANHTCKCLRYSLEKLVTEKPNYKGKGKLTKVNRVRLTTAVRCAIRMRSKDNNVKQLRKDIINSIYHFLGFHDRCSDFCQKKGKKAVPYGDENDDADDDLNCDQESFDDIFESQYEYWKLPSEKEMESSRHASKNRCEKHELKELVKDVQIFLNKIADKCHRLIGNFTTNLCESWMAIRARFDGGKVTNRCARISWNARCYEGALRKNIGVEWSPFTFHNVTKEHAGINFIAGVRRRAQVLNASLKYKAKPESKTNRRKRKLEDMSVCNSKKAKLHYGSNLDDTADVSKQKLKELYDAFLENHVMKSEKEILDIQNKTTEQSISELWKKERHLRLTSSNFGKLMSRRCTNVSSVLVKYMMYSKFQRNIHTIRGLTQEQNTIIEYKDKKGNIEVTKTGLKIFKDHPYLAASTDGIVKTKTDTGLLEIKNLLQTNCYMIKDAIGKVPNFCLECSNNKVQLKKDHEYFYQVQGQLNIFEIEWCDFVVRRTKPYDIHIEKIRRYQNMWTSEMLPKLQCFYFKFILPELSLLRYGTYTGIREPEKPWYPDKSFAQTLITDTVLLSKSADNQDSLVSFESQPPASKNKPCSKEKPGPSHEHRHTDTQPPPLKKRSCRTKSFKFVGREIIHKWTVDEKKKKEKWYSGTVLDVVSGKVGDPSAAYEVLYKGEETAHEVDGLSADLQKGCLNFLDI